MGEQTETSGGPQCYLVTLEVDYERPEIIKGFGCQDAAEAFRTELEAYQRAKPAWPNDGAPRDEWVRFDEAKEAWFDAHPAGRRAGGADRFGIIVAPFVPPVSEPAGMLGMETAPRDGTHILVKYIVTQFVREPRPSPFGGFGHGEYRPVGHKWEEFWFVDGKFETWSGTDKGRTINGGGEPIGWAPLPDAQPVRHSPFTNACAHEFADSPPPTPEDDARLSAALDLIFKGESEPHAVDLPAFDGYQAHIVRELQAAFVQACEKVNIKVKSPEVKS